jgi:hypothetical protein
MSRPPLTPEQRTLRARIAANTRWAREDANANAVRASKGLLARFEREAREQWPDLPEREIKKRADRAYKAHMQSLALRSSRARSERASDGAA